jgi:hypothetical protein
MSRAASIYTAADETGLRGILLRQSEMVETRGPEFW